MKLFPIKGRNKPWCVEQYSLHHPAGSFIAAAASPRQHRRRQSRCSRLGIACHRAALDTGLILEKSSIHPWYIWTVKLFLYMRMMRYLNFTAKPLYYEQGGIWSGPGDSGLSLVTHISMTPAQGQARAHRPVHAAAQHAAHSSPFPAWPNQGSRRPAQKLVIEDGQKVTLGLGSGCRVELQTKVRRRLRKVLQFYGEGVVSIVSYIATCP